MKYVYKKSEETKLINTLSQSKLISKEQLLEIKTLYNQKVPYHNFVHAMKVAEGVLKLPREKYNIIEIQSLFVSALFHDAGHSGVAEDLDEFRSLDMAFEGIINFEKKYDYAGIDYSIVRKAIIGTVFKNRASNKDPYAILLADLDVSTIGMSFAEFLYFADFPFSIECSVAIQSWFHDVTFFKFLTQVDKNIFRTLEVRELYPHSLNNIRQYLTVDRESIQKLFSYWKENDICFEVFEKKYNQILQNQDTIG